MSATFEQRIEQFLRQHTTLTLATWTPDGPQAAPLFYAHAWGNADADDGILRIFFISNPASNHCLALAEQPNVAAAIYQDGQDWRQIRGLQIEGEARLAQPGPDEAQARAAYLAKFPFVATADDLDGAFDLAGPLTRSSFYVIEANWVRLIDNTLGFGHREEEVY